MSEAKPAKIIKCGRSWAVELHGRTITGPLSKAAAVKFLADLKARWVSSKRP